MRHDDQDLIRARAHQIWEREGRPDGRHLEHWEMASAEIAAEAKPAAKPASLAKARARKAAKTAEPAVVAAPRKRTTRTAAVAA
jgi:hypothetical protein